MKRCLECEHRFDERGWRCPNCGWEPLAEPFPVFAPALALSNDAFEPDAFERLARIEPRSFWFRARNRLIASAISGHFPAARSFFEIGCGTGFVLDGLRAGFPDMELSGADIFTEGVRVATRRLPGVSLYQMDGMRIPFREEFDVVGAFDVIEHIEDDAGALAELFRATRPGGGILVSVPQHRFLWGAPDDFAHHRRRYTRRELIGRMRNAGFEILQVTGYVFFLLPVMAASRMRMRKLDAGYNPSSEFDLPRALDRVMESTLNFENALIRRGVSLPAGGSLFAVGKRPAN